MPFSGVKTRVWDRNTPDDGILFNIEYDNVYSDLNDLNDRSLPGYDDTGTPSDFDIPLFDTASGKYKRTDLRNVDIISSRDQLRQSIRNPNGFIDQRLRSDFVDDVYYNDFWKLMKENASLTDGTMKYSVSDDAIQISIIDAVLTTRFGIIEFLESELSVQYFSGKASISFLVKANNTNIPNIRAALLAWDSTADILTSDVVSVWAATPTLATNWFFENTPSNISITTAFTKVTIEGIDIDQANMKNLALFIWVPDQVNDVVLSIKECQMNVGSRVLKFGKRSKVIEKLLAKDWYRKSYDEEDAEGSANIDGCIALPTDDFTNNGPATQTVHFERMRALPSYRVFGLAGTENRVSDTLDTNGANEKIISSGNVFSAPANSGFVSVFNVAGAATAGRFYHYTADASL